MATIQCFLSTPFYSLYLPSLNIRRLFCGQVGRSGLKDMKNIGPVIYPPEAAAGYVIGLSSIEKEVDLLAYIQRDSWII